MSDKMRNLVVRTASGAVLLAVVLGAAYGGTYAYSALLLLIVSVGMWEFYNIVAATGAEPRRTLGLAAGITLFITSFFLFKGYVDPMSSRFGVDMLIGGVLYFSVLIPLCFIVELFHASETPIRNVATTLMGVLYVAYPMCLMLFIPLLITGDWQPEAFLFYLFIVWGNDVFAYLAGVTMGRHKMAPRISPKKSWEGSIGGALLSIASSLVFAHLFPIMAMWQWTGLALVVVVFGTWGDLCESLMKRQIGIKDSGSILPGHGGWLDRFDSALMAIPAAVAYLYFIATL